MTHLIHIISKRRVLRRFERIDALCILRITTHHRSDAFRLMRAIAGKTTDADAHKTPYPIGSSGAHRQAGANTPENALITELKKVRTPKIKRV